MELTLERFRSAHLRDYEIALKEIRAGRKESHWMWYIFPQLQGLGRSAVAMYYEIQGKEEAEAYWQDPVLRDHMEQLCRALLKLEGNIVQILGQPDDRKLHSSMTLFWLVTGEQVFRDVLDKFYGGTLDDYTVHKLK